MVNGAGRELRRRARIVGSFGGGPVGVSTLAVAVGEEATTVEEVCEPFLVRAGMLAHAAWSGRNPAALGSLRAGGAGEGY